MKHILNNLSEEEKNSIREQHTGGMSVMTENFNKLLKSKLGDSKPLVEQHDEGGSDPVGQDEGGKDSDYWGDIIEPKLKANGWTVRVDPNQYQDKGFKTMCPYKCCTYMYKGNHNTGPNIFLDCGEDPKSDSWQITVYTNGNQKLRTFGTGDDAARKAVEYALSLR